MNETNKADRTERRSGAIVLVHGAWVGEWCWKPMLPAVRASGRRVEAVSLRGYGLRSTESGPHITLADHVDDVVDVVTGSNLTSITLVGHSYGGRVISRAWSRVADRVERVVYVDAHAPIGDGAVPQVVERASVRAGMIPCTRFAPDPVEFGGIAAAESFTSRLTPHPARTLDATFAVELPDSLDTTYVAAYGHADSPFATYARAAHAAPNWRYLELDCSHWVMVARPEQLASIVLDPSRHQPPRSVHANLSGSS